MTLILGIDPGLQRMGWGIIRVEGNSHGYIACGAVKPVTSLPMAERLLALDAGLQEIIARYVPQEAAIEETFVSVNGSSTLKLGQARGAILLSLARGGLNVSEYAATTVKQSLTGQGRAEKAQVAFMVKRLLPACDPKSADAADALAIALCHAQHRQLRLRYSQA